MKIIQRNYRYNNRAALPVRKFGKTAFPIALMMQYKISIGQTGSGSLDKQFCSANTGILCDKKKM